MPRPGGDEARPITIYFFFCKLKYLALLKKNYSFKYATRKVSSILNCEATCACCYYLEEEKKNKISFHVYRVYKAVYLYNIISNNLLKWIKQR